MPEPASTPTIDIQRIPVGRSIGAAALIAILLIAMFIDLPGVRATVVWGGAIGIALGIALILWRRPREGRL